MRRVAWMLGALGGLALLIATALANNVAGGGGDVAQALMMDSLKTGGVLVAASAVLALASSARVR